jgi:hypothetical protein
MHSSVLLNEIYSPCLRTNAAIDIEFTDSVTAASSDVWTIDAKGLEDHFRLIASLFVVACPDVVDR